MTSSQPMVFTSPRLQLYAWVLARALELTRVPDIPLRVFLAEYSLHATRQGENRWVIDAHRGRMIFSDLTMTPLNTAEELAAIEGLLPVFRATVTLAIALQSSTSARNAVVLELLEKLP